MSQSEQINELASALSKAQGEMQAAIKDSVNPFFKSKYADLGSVWESCRPVLGKNGLCVIQTTEMLNEKIVMVTTLAHSSGQWIKSYLPLNPAKNDSQGVGSAITYLRRYSLSAIVGVVCDDDDDAEGAMGRGKTAPPKQEKPVEQKQPEPKITQSQVTEITQKMTLCDKEWHVNYFKYMQKQWNASTINDLPASAYAPTINSINRNVEMNKNKVE